MAQLEARSGFSRKNTSKGHHQNVGQIRKSDLTNRPFWPPILVAEGNGTPYFREISVDEILFHLARYISDPLSPVFDTLEFH